MSEYVLTSYVSFPSPLLSFKSFLIQKYVAISWFLKTIDKICSLVVKVLWVFMPEKTLWEEYKWFTSVRSLIKYLTQKTLSEKDVTVSLKEFLDLYKKTRQEIVKILESNGV